MAAPYVNQLKKSSRGGPGVELLKRKACRKLQGIALFPPRIRGPSDLGMLAVELLRWDACRKVYSCTKPAYR